jgi:hypothetical protein
MATPTAPVAAVAPQPKQIVIVSHSTLFYWWPVWAVGFLMAIITLFHHELMVTVPTDTQLVRKVSGTLKTQKEVKGTKVTEEYNLFNQDALIAKEGKSLPVPYLQMTPNKSLGVVYAITLLLVITITNVPLRGLWSAIVIVVIIFVSIIFALLGIWEDILTALSWLDIRINLAGYLFISTVLLALWLVVFFLFDSQIYMIFSPGSLRVRLEIGEGETAYDTTGMTIQKQRSDLFRHWILGLGSGDLIVNTSGAQAHHFDLPNVLALGRRVREIEELLRTKQVVAAPANVQPR